MTDYYGILFILVIILSYWVQYNVRSVYSKFSNVGTDSGITGYDMARKILDKNGLFDVEIGHIGGELSSCYVVKKKQILLSDDVYTGTNAAAIGVAAHEAGHALQYAKSYVPVKLKSFLWPVCNICAKLSMPLLVFGIVLEFYSLASVGVIAFGIATLLELITLPVEFNASRRALAQIRDEGIFNETEILASKKVLKAAALTYVAAFAVSLVQFLRFLSLVRKRR